jgi:N-acetylglucosaminyl-diphospho-decaprenol L-rhamnosyltransferase
VGPHAERQLSSVDAVVVAYNSARHLRGCVETLLDRAGTSVIVVDNASSDGTLESIAELPVTTLRQERNGGFAYGCNAGWRVGTSPFVLFVNPDARIDAESVSALVRVLESEPDVGLAGPRIEDDDGALTYSQRRFPTLRSTFGQALYLHRFLPDAPWTDEVIRTRRLYEEPRDAEWLSGACLLARRRLLQHVGGWDESFFLYSEDTELCRAAWAAGFRVRYEPAAVARHVGGASAGRAQLLAVLAQSRVAYARKNYPPLVALGHRAGIALEALTHTVVARGGLDQRRGHARALLATVGRRA